MTALRIDHLNRSFGSLVVTDDVSLDIAAGERHVIIGPNGAGKTSLVNQIGGQLAPGSGRIFVDGQDITGQLARPDQPDGRRPHLPAQQPVPESLGDRKPAACP